MFADLVRSTDLISELEIDDAQDLLDQFLTDVSEAIHEFGGTVARVQGDGILALFGAPIAKEDHFQRAALAALSICSRCSENETTRNQIAVRIGLHCGELGLRWQGHDFGKTLDVVGATAHIAAKVQQRAPLNGVMVSTDLAEQLGPGFECSEVQGEVSAEHAIAARQLISHAPANSAHREEFGPAGLADGLIGRDDSITLIERLIEAESGTHVIGLTGAPGIGKSRLLLEAERLASLANRPVLRLLGRSLDRSRPFGALAHLHFWNNCDEAPLPIGEPVNLLQGLEGLSSGDRADWEKLSPDARNERVSEHFAKEINSINPNGRLVIIVDDYHFLDSETKRLLKRLADGFRAFGGSLLIGTRPECKDEVDELADCNHLLTPLAEDSAHRFVRHLWAASGMEGMLLPNTIGQTIQQHAQGMPLALRHYSLHCIALVKEGKDPLLALPHQLDTIFRSQIDRLSDELRTVFQTGCVLGYEFSDDELCALMGLERDEVADALARLCDLEMVTQVEAGKFRYAHQLLQEAGYYGIMRKPREKLHRQAYQLLSSQSATGQVSAQVLGWHAARAGLPDTALDHYAEAMRDAIAQGAILTVDELYMQSRSLCEQLGEKGRDRRAILLLYAFDSLQQLGKQEWYRDDVEDAVKRFKRQGDAFRTALATCNLAITDWTGARNEKSLEIAREGERLAADTGHEPLVIYSQFTLGNIEFLCGKPRQGIERLKALVDRLGGVKRTARFGDMISVPGIMVRTFASWYLYDMGDTQLARRYCQEGKELAQIINQNYSHVLAELAEAYLLYRDEEYAEASALLERVVQRCSQQAIYGLETIASARYMCSLVQEGRLDEAEEILTRHRTEGHLAPVQHSCAYYLWEGEARLLAARGQSPEAIEVLNTARSESERQHDPLHALHARILCCEISSGTGVRDESWSAEVAAIRRLAQDYGFLPIVRRCDALQRNESAYGIDQCQ